MDEFLVPYDSPFTELDQTSLNFQNKQFSETRKSVLNELKYFSGLPEIIGTLNPDTVYKFVATPDGAKLYKDAVGNLKGVFYKDGKILEHAKLKAVRADLVKAATTVGSQILLVSIAIQLDRVEKSINRIFKELHNDRIGEINSGVTQFEQAMLTRDINIRSGLTMNAIQTLSTGLEKTIKALKNQIKEAPEPKNSFWDNWFTCKSKDAEEKMGLAEEAFLVSLLGIKTVAECYAALNEPIAAESALKGFMSKLKDADIQTAFKKARLIEAKGNNFPEVPWKTFINTEPEIQKNLELCRYCNTSDVKSVTVEFKPVELLEMQNGKNM
ncbi:MAG: hypothetical protein U9N34_03055 [Candidatus Cloacimonadota bacterium]|nr:hypothetical protein [Candidatus Cloacimonadota bacterium]